MVVVSIVEFSSFAKTLIATLQTSPGVARFQLEIMIIAICLTIILHH